MSLVGLSTVTLSTSFSSARTEPTFLRRDRPLDAELHGLGVERGAVGELDVGLELDDDRLRVGGGRRLGQARRVAAVGVLAHQRVVDPPLRVPVVGVRRGGRVPPRPAERGQVVGDAQHAAGVVRRTRPRPRRAVPTHAPSATPSDRDHRRASSGGAPAGAPRSPNVVPSCRPPIALRSAGPLQTRLGRNPSFGRRPISVTQTQDRHARERGTISVCRWHATVVPSGVVNSGGSTVRQGSNA